jgi:hypothetical protein
MKCAGDGRTSTEFRLAHLDGPVAAAIGRAGANPQQKEIDFHFNKKKNCLQRYYKFICLQSSHVNMAMYIRYPRVPDPMCVNMDTDLHVCMNLISYPWIK